MNVKTHTVSKRKATKIDKNNTVTETETTIFVEPVKVRTQFFTKEKENYYEINKRKL